MVRWGNTDTHNLILTLINMELKDRILQIIKYKGLTPPTFAKKIGAKTKQSIYDLTSGKTKSLSEKMKKKILSYATDVNPIWLITGQGNMLIDNKTQDLSLYETWLLPMNTHSESLTDILTEGAIPQNCERIISPIKDVDFAITVYGDSMAPEYPSGSKVLLKRINPEIFIEWGKTFVLDTNHGILFKEVHYCEREGYITCHSINNAPQYKDFDIPLSEIHGMYRVLMVLMAK